MFTRAAFIAACAAACALFTAPLAYAEDFSPTRFTVSVQGRGPDVILMPGLVSSGAVWDGEAHALSATHRVHVITLSGFAGVPAGPNAQGDILAPAVEELDRYIKARGLHSPAYIGHSMGGLMGLMLARAHPEDVGRVMIVDALPFFSAMMDPNATAQSVAPMAAMFRDQIVAAPDAQFAAMQAQTIARLVRTPSARARVLQWSLASDRRVMAQATYEVMTTDLRGALASIETPLTIVFAHDPVMGPEGVVTGLYEAAYAAAPHHRLQRIDESYHFIMLDQPEAFHAAVTLFLQ